MQLQADRGNLYLQEYLTPRDSLLHSKLGRVVADGSKLTMFYLTYMTRCMPPEHASPPEQGFLRTRNTHRRIARHCPGRRMRVRSRMRSGVAARGPSATDPKHGASSNPRVKMPGHRSAKRDAADRPFMSKVVCWAATREFASGSNGRISNPSPDATGGESRDASQRRLNRVERTASRPDRQIHPGHPGHPGPPGHPTHTGILSKWYEGMTTSWKPPSAFQMQVGRRPIVLICCISGFSVSNAES